LLKLKKLIKLRTNTKFMDNFNKTRFILIISINYNNLIIVKGHYLINLN